MKTSITDGTDYATICEKAATDDSVFATFKQNPSYTGVLEHLPEELGRQYIDLAMRVRTLNYHLNDFRKNDELGSPSIYDYAPYGTLSPTTCRYVKVLSDLITQGVMCDDMNIVEVGGGYGGQCFVISQMFPSTNYTLVDLEPCLRLQKRYLDAHGVKNITYATMDDVRSMDSNFDLFISNYAFTECTKDIQNLYLNKLAKRSKRGYMTCNFINSVFGLDYHTKENLLQMISGSKESPEVPSTFNSNCLLTW